ncbi:MAG: hypothetical protein F9K44_02860 [Hyphomicrobiaceae bacterium]|nr:MAG: hypothetical protein F9K44_02860 [Hyphomicrobiaceae bacterium]
MNIVLSGRHRTSFAEDLAAHRGECHENDADYARLILRISLNTLKKCLEPDPARPLSLKRQTLIAICTSAGLDPARYGLNVKLPSRGREYGAYTKADFGFMAGRYLLHRRSFLTGSNINRSLLEIRWNDREQCLSFQERIRYRSDGGVPQQFEYNGEIFMHRDRVLMSMLSNDAGELRMIMSHTPNRPAGRARSAFKLHGVMLTHGFPRGYFQPVVSAVQIESVPASATISVDKACRTIAPGDPDFDRLGHDLKHAEEHATIMTPLLQRKLARPAG